MTTNIPRDEYGGVLGEMDLIIFMRCWQGRRCEDLEG